MTIAAPWHNQPLFVSGTFRDMHAERDYLRDHVFPQLQEHLRGRRHHLEPIDLRQGVDTVSIEDEQSKELLVLKVCLTEIERSRPFLIAILGDRYGWVPPHNRMQAAADEVGFQANIAGTSITALEIQFGVLSSPVQKRRSYFYFREPLPYHEMDATSAALYSESHRDEPAALENEKKLSKLKQRIEKDPSLKGRVRTYQATWDSEHQRVTGLESFGKMVLDDLWRDLDLETREYATQSPPTPQDEERWVLEQFIEDCSRGFVGRHQLTDEILEIVRQPSTQGMNWGICVTGDPGTGKSSLFANIAQILQRSGTFILAHAAGISAASTSIDSMLRRWIADLAAELRSGVTLPESAGAEQLHEMFETYLRDVSVTRRVVVLVDATNQFERTRRAWDLAWLPQAWPMEARLVITGLPGVETEVLSRRDCVRQFVLPPLETSEARAIASDVFKRYHREPNRDVVDIVLAKRRSDATHSAGNPLWLQLALEELNLLDGDDFARAEEQYPGPADERLHRLQIDTAMKLPGGVESLYSWMLERLEGRVGGNFGRQLVNLIAVSRAGWRDSDLRQLMPTITGQPWRDVEFASVRRALRAHLVQRGPQAQWDFFHSQMRQAVLRSNLREPTVLRDLRRRIANYLRDLPTDDAVRQAELVFRGCLLDRFGGSKVAGRRTTATHVKDHASTHPALFRIDTNGPISDGDFDFVAFTLTGAGPSAQYVDTRDITPFAELQFAVKNETSARFTLTIEIRDYRDSNDHRACWKHTIGNDSDWDHVIIPLDLHDGWRVIGNPDLRRTKLIAFVIEADQGESVNGVFYLDDAKLIELGDDLSPQTAPVNDLVDHLTRRQFNALWGSRDYAHSLLPAMSQFADLVALQSTAGLVQLLPTAVGENWITQVESDQYVQVLIESLHTAMDQAAVLGGGYLPPREMDRVSLMPNFSKEESIVEAAVMFLSLYRYKSLPRTPIPLRADVDSLLGRFNFAAFSAPNGWRIAFSHSSGEFLRHVYDGYTGEIWLISLAAHLQTNDEYHVDITAHYHSGVHRDLTFLADPNLSYVVHSMSEFRPPSLQWLFSLFVDVRGRGVDTFPATELATNPHDNALRYQKDVHAYLTARGRPLFLQLDSGDDGTGSNYQAFSAFSEHAETGLFMPRAVAYSFLADPVAAEAALRLMLGYDFHGPLGLADSGRWATGVAEFESASTNTDFWNLALATIAFVQYRHGANEFFASLPEVKSALDQVFHRKSGVTAITVP